MSGDWTGSAVQFLLSGLFIVIAGVRLAQHSDTLALHSPLGGVWIGSLLLAGASSLPEVAVSASAAGSGAPDIAVGNVFGSNVFNIFMLAIADFFDGPGPLLRRVAGGHIVVGTMGILLSALAAFLLMLPEPAPALFGVGADVLLITATYFLGVRLITGYQRRPAGQQAVLEVDPAPPRTRARRRLQRMRQAKKGGRPVALWRVYAGFAGWAAVIVGAGVRLTHSAEQLAEITGLGATFVGSILVAATTSLPELVAVMASVLRGSYDLAVGTVLGSNTFNMLILLVADVAYRPGPILAVADPGHALVAMGGVIMSSLVVMGLFYRFRRDYVGLGPDAVAIMAAYFLLTYTLFQLR